LFHVTHNIQFKKIHIFCALVFNNVLCLIGFKFNIFFVIIYLIPYAGWDFMVDGYHNTLMIALPIIIQFLQIKNFRKYFSKNKFLWRKIWIIKTKKIVKMRISKLINYSTNMFEVAKVPTMVIFVPMTSLQIWLIYHHYPTSKMTSLATCVCVFF